MVSNPHVPKGQPVLSRPRLPVPPPRLDRGGKPVGFPSRVHVPGCKALLGKTEDSGAWKRNADWKALNAFWLNDVHSAHCVQEVIAIFLPRFGSGATSIAVGSLR